MSYSIDTTTYNKAKVYPVDHGYSVRPAAPTSVVVHSTEGVQGQTLQSAADYIYHSSKISADFLIGKNGEIVQFLDSSKYYAWHAGNAQAAYANHKSIGIECLHAAGESWPAAQKDCLSWLLGHLIATYNIAHTLIDTHGQIAIAGPYDRKKDPTNWPHSEFIAWRDATLAAAPAYVPYTILSPCSVFTDRRPDAPLAGGPDSGITILVPGDTVNVGQLKDGWLWVSDGPNTAPGIGFIPSSYARRV